MSASKATEAELRDRLLRRVQERILPSLLPLVTDRRSDRANGGRSAESTLPSVESSGRFLKLADFANNELSLRLVDKFLVLQVQALDPRVPVARAIAACDDLEELLDRAYGAAHTVLDRAAAADRGSKGGKKTHAASDELKQWAVDRLDSVPANLKTASARAQWLILKSPETVRKSMPNHRLEDPERVIREHLSSLARGSTK